MAFGADLGSSLGSGIGSSLGQAFGNLLGVNNSKVSATQSGTRTVKRDISQEGIDKIIYDIMSSDQGLAALASAENASGGYRSSSKSLLAQDLVAKVVGEVANLTAATTEEFSGSSEQKTKKGSVICTQLHARGFIANDVFRAGQEVFKYLNPTVVRGYHFWAIPFVEKVLKPSTKWHLRMLPWVAGRYDYCVYGKWNLRGALTVWIGHPVCWAIGSILKLVDGVRNGRSANVAA